MLPKESYEKMGLQSGYALPRMQFDYMMFQRGQEIVRENGGSVIQGFSVHEIMFENENGVHKIKGVKGRIGGRKSDNDELVFTSAVTIGAGGYNCPVSRVITELHNEPHSCLLYTSPSPRDRG